jgi:hypothetical protein
MHFWYYFNKSSHLQFHDFTTTIKPPQNIRRLLGLCLKFIPKPRWTQIRAATEFKKTTIDRFERDLILKGHFGPGPIPSDEAYNPRLYNKSAWIPPTWRIPAVVKHRLPAFSRQVKFLFNKKHGRTNLLPFQRRALASLQRNPDLIVAQYNKNLGPATIETVEFIKMVYHDHLNDTVTYTFVTESAVPDAVRHINKHLLTWIKDWKEILTKHELGKLRKLARTNEYIFPVFYVTLKAHKSPQESTKNTSNQLVQWKPPAWSRHLG